MDQSIKTDILIVDDERINLKLLEGVLNGFDVTVHKAQSGPEALELTQEHDFALVLLDVMMPGMDGFVTAERIRSAERTRNVPIIFVTAISKEQKHVFKGYELGAVDYLFKPVEPEILKSKVKIFVELHRQRRALEITGQRLAGTVAELEASRLALLDSQRSYRTVARYTFDWEAWVGPGGELLYISPSCQRICGYTDQEFMNDSGLMDRIVHDEDREMWRSFVAGNVRNHESGLDFRILHRDGQLRWVSQVNFEVHDPEAGYMGVRTSIRDITERKKMELQLRHQALHDPLTEIANRTLLQDRINQALARSSRHSSGRHWAVIFLDLDRFKVVNDSLGHTFGDKLLVEVSNRLLTCVRSKDTVSRFGGDEFVLVLEDLESPGEAMRILKRVQCEVARPFLVDGHEVQTTASMGVVLSPTQADRPEELIQKANLAMYRAKEAGRNRFHIFNDAMLEQAIRLMNMESDLRRAIANREFHLVYQPIVSLTDGNLVGFEALCRWEHPEQGFISPGEFIPVAEESGLIVELGRWVLEEACTTMAAWRRRNQGMNGEFMSVNISGRQFQRTDLLDQVRTVLDQTRIPPNLLKLEITETAIMADVQVSTKTLNSLKDEGLTLSIDDFGTGYSSMSYLQRFPMDHLKVDLSFVQRIDSNKEDVEIVRAIINLAHSLRMKVVAEGIERVEQKDLLHSLQCEYGQGYLFSKPMDRTSAEALIIQNVERRRAKN